MDISDAIELFQQHLYVEKGLSKQTVSSYTNDLKKYFQYFKDKKTVEDLMVSDLEEYLQYIQAVEGRSVSTVCRKISSILTLSDLVRPFQVAKIQKNRQ